VTALDITLTPAQWEHLDRHGWTLTAAPTPVQLPDAAGAYPVGPAAPVPATVPCPECGGTGQARIGDLMTYLPPCRRCSGSGVVPRVVVVVRPEMAIRYPYLYRDPAEQVGTATVTAVPVVDGNPLADEGEPGYVERPALVRYVSRRVGLVLAYCPDGERWHDVTHLFPTPPKPGDTVWRLDRNEDR